MINGLIKCRFHFLHNEWNSFFRSSIILRITWFFSFLLISTVTFSQLQVTPNNNATQLAQTLAGAGVTISGETINCPSNSIPVSNPSGTFVGTSSNIGITSGVLLTTGDISIAVGPNNSASAGVDNQVTFSDPDLTTIEPQAIHDVCILEFNAKPSCDTLEFTFAFGSEEYNEYVNSVYNDAFGIFVTGNNPSGPNYAAFNMALIPFTTTPVAINNVNNGNNFGCSTGPCTNCNYYFDNCNGTTVQYDGFTKPVTVKLPVIPCDNYHFKLAIADAGDGVYDSGVFFAFQSLVCNTTLIVNTSITPAPCSSNGSATVTSIVGGTAPYTYTWNTSPAQTTQTATGLLPGNYTVTVVDANGCLNGTSTVTIPGTPPVTFSSSVITNENCFGDSIGSASVNVLSGSSPYSYSWSPSGETTATATGLASGTYSITVTDSFGCSSTNTIAISSPPLLTHSFSPVVNIDCFGNNNGSASVNVSGGTPAYSYIWNGSPAQTTQTITGLAAGNYTVTVGDSHGCSFMDTISILTPPLLTHSMPATTNVDCFGNNTGSASVNVLGGTPSYTYSWSPPLGSQTTQTATGLYAGVYSVTVTDAHGCSFTDTAMIVAPSGLGAFSPVITNADCFGNSTGSATVIPYGGTPGYTYSWNPTSQTSSAATGLAAGVYTITVTDNNGCIVKTLAQVMQPSLLTSTSNQTNVLCFGDSTGNATINISGGTPGYSYLWSPGTQTTSAATNLPIGNYSVLVTDTHGCTLTSSFTITQPAAPISASISSIDVLCNSDSNGSSTITVSGGVPGYTYSWNPTGQTTSAATGLPAGVYTVSITDNNGCVFTPLVTITQPALLTDTSIQTNVLCFGDSTASATVNIFGGTTGYTYSWSPGFQTTSTATNLSSGSYSVLVTDAHGCTLNSLFTITQPSAPLSEIISSVNVLCNPDNTGSATATISGGTPGYSYSWVPGGQTSQSISNLSAGNYSVTVTDTNGCATTSSITITQPSPLTASILSDTSICAGTNALDSVIASGGTPGYIYFWTPSGATTQSVIFSPASTTSYTAQVTDANGCSAPLLITTVTVTPLPVIAFTSLLDTCTHCLQLKDQSTNAIAWFWDFGDNTTSTLQNPDHCFSGTGMYNITLTVNSSPQCKNMLTVSDSILGYELAPLIPNVFTPNGDGLNDVFKIKGLDKCSPYSIKIYDRWGVLVFATETIDFVWDGTTSAGKKAAEGVYYYILINSNTTKTGYITLLR